MAEMKIHKEERLMSRADVAVELRRLADELESGTISYGSGGSLVVPEQVEREFEIEREDEGTKTEYEVEFELKWYAPRT